MRWTLPCMVSVTFLLAPPGAMGQYKPPPTPKKTSPPKSETEPSPPIAANSVDKLIAEALRNNPDIRFADAKVKEAEAEAHRSRLKVATQVGAVHAEIEAARAAEKETAMRYLRALELHRRAAISREDLDTAQLTKLKFKAELAAAEAKLPYLLGRQPGAGGPQGVIDDLIKRKWLASVKDTKVTDEEFLRRVMLDVYGRVPTAAETKDYMKLPEKERREKWLDRFATPTNRLSIRHDLAAWVGATCIQCHTTPVRLNAADAWMGHHDMWAKFIPDGQPKASTPATEKLRTALDGKIRVAFDKTPITDVMEFLHDKALPDVNLVLRGKARTNVPVTVKLEAPVPVGAVLQCLEDELNVVFILRDYGIVVVSADDRLPPGAMRVVDFWKRGKSGEPSAADKEKSKTPAAEKKTGDIRGTIEKIDAKDKTLVQVSVGLDAGLKTGDTLELFRTQPTPAYVGRLQLVDLTSGRSVGRFIFASPLKDRTLIPRVGDLVALRLREE